MDLKSCKQCGAIKPPEQFRKYYGGRTGRYTSCKQCERINSREKYLRGKEEFRTPEESAELEMIHTLWESQRNLGFQPPRQSSRNPVGVADDIQEQIAMYEDLHPATEQETSITAPATPELLEWLNCELTKEPEFYQDDIYEALKEKYRPVLRIDSKSMTPVYDDTYKTTLDQILERFDAYEDRYYG